MKRGHGHPEQPQFGAPAPKAVKHAPMEPGVAPMAVDFVLDREADFAARINALQDGAYEAALQRSILRVWSSDNSEGLRCIAAGRLPTGDVALRIGALVHHGQVAHRALSDERWLELLRTYWREGDGVPPDSVLRALQAQVAERIQAEFRSLCDQIQMRGLQSTQELTSTRCLNDLVLDIVQTQALAPPKASQGWAPLVVAKAASCTIC